ncbi:Splicing coactivator SRm160/300, subunit SRm300 [Phytophthora cinnamomi]|uniref:Splicing coactivator SRm160/300, subunit SRm300 n=1 Tax=Phytophthora cinnamomi TaxID=4785 RepID=UPI00355A5397|nr:Splicing coactivator SRm160/300, subunit SRm300 [Phytophthora cinnamomi]
MYNGIGLRTVRGSGTNGYVQRNLSHVSASRTRQTLARNQRGGSSGDFGAHRGGKSRPPPNADILLHEQKRKVELQLLEMSLEMEDRGCDPEEIQDKVKRERERLLARLNEAGDRARDKAKDAESSHARQKRKEEENRRIKDAFGIATDYVAGESFDPEAQERRRLERKERREQEWKEREEARQQRLKEREEREDKMRERRDRFRSPHSRSRSRPRRSRSPADRRSRDRRSRGRDEPKMRRESKSPSRSPVAERRPKRSASTTERKRRSASSSSSGSSRSRSSGASSPSRSRSRSRKMAKRSEKALSKKKRAKRSRSRSSSRSASSSESSSGSDSDRSHSPSRGRSGYRDKKAGGKVKEEKLSVSVSPARSAVLKGEHKVLNLSGRSASVSAVADESPRREPGNKKEPRDSKASVKKGEDNKKRSLVAKKEETKPEASKAEKQETLPDALPVLCVSGGASPRKKRVVEGVSQSASPADAVSVSILGQVPLTFGLVGFFSLPLGISST